MATNLRKANIMADELDIRSFLATKAGIIRALAASIIYDAIEIGKHLTEVQERLKSLNDNKHGRFTKWLADEFEWGHTHAYRFITLYGTYGNGKNVPHGVQNFSIKALLALAAPDVPKDVRTDIINQDKKFTEKEVKEAIAKAIAQQIEEKDTLENKVATTEDKLNKLKESHDKRIKKLQEKHAADLKELQKTLQQTREPTSSDFEKQVKLISNPLVAIILNQGLAKMINDLELIKEEIVNEFDMYALNAVIRELEIVSEQIKTWAIRLTPTNEKWKQRPRKI